LCEALCEFAAAEVVKGDADRRGGDGAATGASLMDVGTEPVKRRSISEEESALHRAWKA
jgi:hypothetical protein